MKSLVVSFALIAPLFGAPTAVKVAEGFARPVDLTAAKGLDKILFVVEQHGVITAIDAVTGERLAEVLDIEDRVTRAFNEQGLLGLTFSPNFAEDHRFYVNYTDKGTPTETHVSRFILDPKTLTASPDSEEKIYSFTQDFSNHNGGWVGFGPDGYLYISAGDGGSGYDPKARGQDLSSPLGTLLRIDVSGESGYTVPADNPFLNQSDAVPEIYAYGLRNAWRCAFDKQTGDLWIADVGQNAFEEINFMPKGTAKGQNFGWRQREATHATPKKKGPDVGGDKPTGAIDPIYEYSHGSAPNEGQSITGGYVYRGPNEELQGRYFFADFVSQRIWSIRQENGEAVDFQDHTKSLSPRKGGIGPVSSFGEDNDGNVYLLAHGIGQIYRIE